MDMAAAPMPAPLAMPKPVTHDVTLLVTRKYAQAKVLGVPPEEFGIERYARDIKTCNYCFHDIVTKSRAELIAEGYDENQVNSLPEYNGLTNAEEQARDTVWESSSAGGATTNKSAQIVKITEHYCRLDYEGNGKPKLYLIVTGGDDGQVLKRDGELACDEIDMIPFAAGSPIPVPHRFFGKSIADVVIPVQLEKSALKRGALDNMYLHNNPRVEVAEANAGPNTLDDLLVSRPGGIVRTKTPGGLNWQVVPDITGSIYPMMQYLDAEIETRTGLSKQSQGIDANALQNQSATAVAQVFSSSQMRVKMIARVLAEGIRDMFSLLHATIRKHGDQASTVRLRNQWINVDPRNWKTRDDMTINVGLGVGGKAQQFAQVMALANFQKELIQGGKTNIVDDAKIFNTASEVTKIMGHKNPDKFFNDPSAKNPQTGQLMYPPPTPAADPKLQVEQMRQQGKQQELMLKFKTEQAKAQTDAIHQMMKAKSETEVAQIKAQLDAQLAIIQAHIDAAQSAQEMHHDQQAHHIAMVGKIVDVAAAAHSHDAKIDMMKQQAASRPKSNG